MLLAAIFCIAGTIFLCWLMFTLAIYALPAFAGLTAGIYAYDTGAGLIGAIVVGTLTGASILVVGQVLVAVVHATWIKVGIAAAFALPAAAAGYHVVHGLSAFGGMTGGWGIAAGWTGAIVVGSVAWVRMGALPPGRVGTPISASWRNDTALRNESDDA